MARKPSAAVLAARKRRLANAGRKNVQIDWYIDNVVGTVEMTMKQRVTLATHFLKDKIVRNISRPVTKISTPGGRDSKGRFLKTKTRVTDRSKPGEFPKADTTQLMKSIFEEVRQEKNEWVGYVGTPLDYGLILETSDRLNRSFLQRTLNEERARITKILTGPIKTARG